MAIIAMNGPHGEESDLALPMAQEIAISRAIIVSPLSALRVIQLLYDRRRGLAAPRWKS